MTSARWSAARRPFLALIVPLILVAVVDGKRGLRQTWPAALVAGVTFAIAQFVCSNYISVELTDIIAALVSTFALVGFLRVWKPSEPMLTEPTGGPLPTIAGASGHDAALERSVRLRDQSAEEDTTRQKLEAFAPYIIIVVVFALAKLVDPIEKFLFEFGGGTAFNDADAKTPNGFEWPGLNVVDCGAARRRPRPPSRSRSGTRRARSCCICGLLTVAVLRINIGDALRAYAKTLKQLAPAIVTVMAVLGLAYVMNLTGMTGTIGRWIAGAGDAFAFLSPIIGWLGVAITGSDTSSNALFGALQVEAAKGAGLSETLMAASNSSGGVLGKMISPQNLAIGAAAVGLGRQGGRHLPPGPVLEPGPAAGDVRAGLPAVD